MSWMRVLTEEQRVAGAREIKPGVLASPWERETCQHGRPYPVRWRWLKGETIETSKPEGSCGCAKCNMDEDG